MNKLNNKEKFFFLLGEENNKKFLNLKYIFSFFLIISIILIIIGSINKANTDYTKVCNSKKCEIRLKLLEEAKKYHKVKEAIINYSMIRIIYNNKSILKVSEYNLIKNELSSLYDLTNKKEVIIYHKDWDKNDEKTKTLNKLYKISSGNLNFVGTVLGENGNLNKDLRSYVIGSNGYYDYGLCQINKGYHKTIVNNPKFNNLDFQINKCWELYANGTKFYGAIHKNKMISKLIINKA